jgi:hypothetical protein
MKTFFIESNLSNFEDFHDGEWLKQVYQAVKDTSCESIAEEFISHWWGSARAFILPWLLVNGVYDGVYSLVPPDKSQQDVWNEYLTHVEFQGALWKLAEGTYYSIYYAYENLIVNILNKIKGTGIRVTDREFNKVLTEVYGDKLALKIWNSSFISVSREVRNCIVHNGGKPSTRLLRMKPLPPIRDGNILISASDTRFLYDTLKPLAYEILTESLRKMSTQK